MKRDHAAAIRQKCSTPEFNIPPMNPPLPLAVNMKEAAALIGLDYDTARKYGLYERWQEAGLIWEVPGTRIRRVVVEELRQWVVVTLAEQTGYI